MILVFSVFLLFFRTKKNIKHVTDFFLVLVFQIKKNSYGTYISEMLFFFK